MISDSLWQNIEDKIKTTYNQVDDLGGSSLAILAETIRRFNQTQAPQAAASMAYYALFSLFPLLLALIAVGSFVLESQEVQQRLLELVTETIPVSQDLIRQNIQQLLDLRGPIGIVGLIGLLWAGSSVFNALTYNINRAWKKEDGRNFLERRLVALGIEASITKKLACLGCAVFWISLTNKEAQMLKAPDLLGVGQKLKIKPSSRSGICYYIVSCFPTNLRHYPSQKSNSIVPAIRRRRNLGLS